jgi:hypothetical protein
MLRRRNATSSEASEQVFAGIVGGTRPIAGTPSDNLVNEELNLAHRVIDWQWQVGCCL